MNKSEEEKVYDFYVNWAINNPNIDEYAGFGFFMDFDNGSVYNEWKCDYYKSVGRKEKIKKIYERYR